MFGPGRHDFGPGAARVQGGRRTTACLHQAAIWHNVGLSTDRTADPLPAPGLSKRMIGTENPTRRRASTQ